LRKCGREQNSVRKMWEASGPTEKVMGNGSAQHRVPWTGSCVVEVAGMRKARWRAVSRRK
jgi:hypothetical protein